MKLHRVVSLVAGLLFIGTLVAFPLSVNAAKPAKRIAVARQETVSRSDQDGRIGYVNFSPERGTEIVVGRGVAMRVILSKDEKIRFASSGWGADCNKETDFWCVTYTAGQNQIWVIAKDGATQNNIEVQTEAPGGQRDYSLNLRVVPSDKAFQRVYFRYAVEMKAAPVEIKSEPSSPPFTTAAGISSSTVSVTDTRSRNEGYTQMEVGAGDAISPASVYDDGLDTYFVFGPGRRIPAIFRLSGDVEEHVTTRMIGQVYVVEGTSQSWVLRAGEKVVRIWQAAPSAGVARSLNRVVKEGLVTK